LMRSRRLMFAALNFHACGPEITGIHADAVQRFSLQG
jgi:hypothetical protein